MIIAKYLKTAEKLASDNAPMILTAVGVVGTLSTAYLTGKASIRAYKILEHEEVVRNLPLDKKPFERKDKFQLVWRLYIPAVATGVITCTAIIGANRIGTRRAAAMASAMALSKEAFAEYKEKMVEKIGASKEQKVRDEIAQDRMDRAPLGEREVVLVGNGDVLCFDSLTGRYFNSNMESLRKAQNDINEQIIQEMCASLSEFYDKIGLSHTAYSDEVGWDTDEMLELKISTTLAEDGRPCLSVDYQYQPTRTYRSFR